MSRYDDGHTYCFSCKSVRHSNNVAFHNRREDDNYIYNINNITNSTKETELTNLTPIGNPNPIINRKIHTTSTTQYNVSLLGPDIDSVNKHVYPYFDREGTHVANKIRAVREKGFFWEGNPSKAGLFGQHLYPPGGKYITITEGELDCLAAYQMMGSQWPCVSVKDGAAAALKCCKQAYEYLDSFDSIIISFDSDDQGRAAALEVANLFGPKAKIMSHSTAFKDACEYLVAGSGEKFVKDWWSATPYIPDDLVNAYDLKDSILERKKAVCVPSPWQGYDDLTYGFRLGEMVTLAGGAGMGKTSMMRELEYHFLMTTEYKLGGLFLEETAETSAEGMISLNANIPFHIPGRFNSETEAAWHEGHEACFADKRVTYFTVFGGQFERVLSRIRFLAKGLDCKVIFLDHIGMMVSGDNKMDERKQLDFITDQLKKITVELDVLLIVVAHTRRQTGKPHEEGRQVSLADIRGTAGIGQLSNLVIGCERDGQHEDIVERNTTTVRVLKNRFCGLTGPACRLFYNEDTGRLTEVQPEEPL